MSKDTWMCRILGMVSNASAPTVPPATPSPEASESDTAMVADAAATATSGAVKPQRVAVVGGGPAGALMALYLSHTGCFEVDVFEATEENRIAGGTYRSWNVILFDRACAALEAGGFDLLKEAGDIVVTITGNVRHSAKQKLGSGFALGTKSICRGDLAMALLKKARQSPNVTVHFGCSFTKMDVQKRVATFEHGNGETMERSFDMLVGADGVHSRVRSALQDHAPDFTVQNTEGPMAFKTIQAQIMDMEGADESWKSRVHTSTTKKGAMIGSPRSDGVATGVVILPTEGNNTFENLMKTTQDVRDFFGSTHTGFFGPEGPSEEVARSFLQQRPGRVRSVYCSQLAYGNVVLIGDAAHAMQASLGQGINCAFEDCQILAQLLASEQEKTGATTAVSDIPKVLEAYSKLRLEDVHAICELSDVGATMTENKALAAQLFLTVILNKTLGRIVPKIFPPPSMFTVNNKNRRYREIFWGFEREAVVAKGFFVASCALAVAGVARRAIDRT